MTEQLHFHFSLSCIVEGNGNPLQYSCLENPKDRGGWWAAVYGVAQSRRWLKWLSSSSSKTSEWNFLGGSDGEEPTFNAGDPDSIPGSGRSLVEKNGNPLQYSCLENPMDWGAWWAAVHGVTKSWTWLSDFTYLQCLLKMFTEQINEQALAIFYEYHNE